MQSGKHIGQRGLQQLALLAPEAAPIVRIEGVDGLKGFLSSDRDRFRRVLTAVALASQEAFNAVTDWIISMPEDEQDGLTDTLKEIIEIGKSAGFTGQVGSDNEVNDGDADALAVNVAIYKRGSSIYKKACLAAGGANRLRAIMAWINLDPDLRRIVEGMSDE